MPKSNAMKKFEIMKQWTNIHLIIPMHVKVHNKSA